MHYADSAVVGVGPLGGEGGDCLVAFREPPPPTPTLHTGSNRFAVAMRLWLSIRCLGLDQIRASLSKSVALAIELERNLRHQPDTFEKVRRCLGSVCFRLKAKHRGDVGNALCEELYEAMSASGEMTLDKENTAGVVVLRMVCDGRFQVLPCSHMHSPCAAAVSADATATGRVSHPRCLGTCSRWGDGRGRQRRGGWRWVGLFQQSAARVQRQGTRVE